MPEKVPCRSPINYYALNLTICPLLFLIYLAYRLPSLLQKVSRPRKGWQLPRTRRGEFFRAVSPQLSSSYYLEEPGSTMTQWLSYNL